MKTKLETPAEKARRKGVPVIPARPARPFPESNPVIGICGACGAEMRVMMHMSCNRPNCPCFAQVQL